MGSSTFSTVDEITSYYQRNISLYGIEAPRTMGYRIGPIDDRLICPLLPESLPPSYSVLDVGCGLGQLIPIVEDKFPGCHLAKFQGIDLVDEFVQRAAATYPRHQFLTSNFLQWESSERFDLVLAAGVLVSRVKAYEAYLGEFIEKMISHSKQCIGFNVVASCGSTYTAKHLVTISKESLAELLARFSNVEWHIKTIEVFAGSEDMFVVGTMKKTSSIQA